MTKDEERPCKRKKNGWRSPRCWRGESRSSTPSVPWILSPGGGAGSARLLLLLIALAVIPTTSPGVFYRQVRIGRGGKSFRIFKFRLMVTDADKKGLAITVGRDSRITRVGADSLRKTKLDELAQLPTSSRGR